MNFPLFLARRIALPGSQSNARFIIRIAMVAVALSLTVMIVATSLIRGFKNQISDKIFGFWGHIHITDANVTRNLEAIPIAATQTFYPSITKVGQIDYKAPLTIGPWESEDYIQRKKTIGGIRHIQAYATKAGIINTKKDIEGIVLKGVGRDFDWSFLSKYILEGTKINLSDTVGSRDIIISKQTADRMEIGIGDKFIVYFVQGEAQSKRVFQVSGIYKTGLEEYDRKFALVDIRQIQNLQGWTNDQVGGFEVFVDNIADLEPLTEEVYSHHIPNTLYAENIRQKFPAIFEWLTLQDINEFIILLLMAVVAIINMTTALLILILERSQMIGLLKAMGSRNGPISRIFLYHASYIIGLGLFWGNIIGIGLCLIQQHFQLIKLNEANYYLSYAPIELNLGVIFTLNISVLLITLVFLYLPSLFVSRIDPVKAIRFR